MKKNKLNDKKHGQKNGPNNPSATRPNQADHRQGADGKLPPGSPSAPHKSEPEEKSPGYGDVIELHSSPLCIPGKLATLFCITDRSSRLILAHHVEFHDEMNGETSAQTNGRIFDSMMKKIKGRYEGHSLKCELIPDNGPFKKPGPDQNG